MQIIFSYHKGSLVSKLIMQLTSSPVSHVSIRFGHSEKNWMVEATRDGVRPGWWNTFLKTSKVVYAFELININEYKVEEIIDECLDEMIGKAYDIKGIIGFAIVIFLRKIGFKNVKNFLGSSKLYFCSEFVLRVAQKIQEKLHIQIYIGDPDLISPLDLLKQSSNNKYLQIAAE